MGDRRSPLLAGAVDQAFVDAAAFVEAYPAGFVRYNLLQGDAETQSVTLYSEEETPFEIKSIDVKGDRATAVYTWVSQFKLNNKAMTESDIKRMELRRGPEGWRILSGI